MTAVVNSSAGISLNVSLVPCIGVSIRASVNGPLIGQTRASRRRNGRGSSARCRAATTARGPCDWSGPSRTRAASPASRSGATIRASRRRRGPTRPSRRTRSPARPTAGCRRRWRQRSADQTRPSGSGYSVHSSRPSWISARSTPRSPSTLHRWPRRSSSSPPGANRSSPRWPRITASSPSSHIARSMPSTSAIASSERRDDLLAAVGIERVDHRRALRRAERHLRRGHLRAGPARPRRRDREVGERQVEADPLLDRRLRVVRADHDRVLGEELVGAAAGVEQPLELTIGRRQRGHLGMRPVAVRPRVVVGQREQHEVEQVVLDQIGADAAGVLIARARQAQLALAAGLARRVQIGVEQLLGPEDRAPEQRRGDDPRQRRLLGDLVLVAAAVDQVRGPGGAHVGVVERLEHRLDVVRRGARSSSGRRCRSATAAPRTDARPRSSSRTRRSGTRRGGTSSSTGSRARRDRRRW